MDQTKYMKILEKLVQQNGGWKPYDKNCHARIDPGTVVKTDSGELFLIGDINGVLGICDDCTVCSYDEIAEYGKIF